MANKNSPLELGNGKDINDATGGSAGDGCVGSVEEEKRKEKIYSIADEGGHGGNNLNNEEHERDVSHAPSNAGHHIISKQLELSLLVFYDSFNSFSLIRRVSSHLTSVTQGPYFDPSPESGS